MTQFQINLTAEQCEKMLNTTDYLDIVNRLRGIYKVSEIENIIVTDGKYAGTREEAAIAILELLEKLKVAKMQARRETTIEMIPDVINGLESLRDDVNVSITKLKGIKRKFKI